MGESRTPPVLVRAIPLAFAAMTALTGPAGAQPPDNRLPPALEGVGIEPRLDARIPADVRLVDEAGREVRVGDLLGERPTILVFAYYRCPMLCSLVLTGVLQTVRALALDLGRDFQVLTVSFDPAEGPDDAAAARAQYLSGYDASDGGASWRFLTGPAEAVGRLADSVGFRYRFDPATQQYAHAAGIVILTPDGRVARYFYGVEFPARDVRLGIVEASAGRVGSPADAVLLFCYQYDPATGRYSLAIVRALRAAGVLTVALLLGGVAIMLRRERANQARPWR